MFGRALVAASHPGNADGSFFKSGRENGKHAVFLAFLLRSIPVTRNKVTLCWCITNLIVMVIALMIVMMVLMMIMLIMRLVMTIEQDHQKLMLVPSSDISAQKCFLSLEKLPRFFLPQAVSFEGCLTSGGPSYALNISTLLL